MQKIPLSQVVITDEIRAAVLGAVESGRYILADQCAAFESEFAAYIGMKHCVLSANWTAAVYLLHMAMDVKAGDEIIVPAHTAFPTIEPLIHNGAKPVFVDVDDTYCADPSAIEAAVTPHTVGILPVHLYGHPADMDPILKIARKHGLWVLEDCAQAHGARYKGRRVGTIGDASAFSFYPSKNLSVLGDGGCIMTNDDAVAQRVRMLRDHGRRSKYTHDLVGFNLRFNEINAAVGRVLLRHLDRHNAHRREIAKRYRERLSNVVQVPIEREWAEAVYHMYVVRTKKRDGLAEYLQKQGIGTGVHYPVPNHRQPAILSLYSDLPALPRTEALVDEILSLPIYGEMPMESVDRVCDAIAAFQA
ncbi:MAG TPA: DegT/DnrJ/EryC1/StrS family aminotransferase [Candidatus Cybelea sp.]|nr:DegT/DnrJ/EryC1/StrS family aminotransferase [Candidatus Cybelea sp.]